MISLMIRRSSSRAGPVCVKEASVNRPDPAPPPPKVEKDDDDDDANDDAKADEMMQKMLKQGQEFIERQKQKK